MSQPHVGYGSLESLLDSHNPENPVYLLLITEDTGQLVGRRNYYVHVSDLEFDMRVARYCRIRVGSSELLQGEPVQPQENDRCLKRAHSAQQVVEEHIRSVRKFSIHSAMVDHPRDCDFIVGGADCMRYDKDADKYVSAGRRPAKGK